MRGNLARVGQDLWCLHVFLRRHITHFFEQRQVDVGLDVAHRAGITVPIASAAEIAASLDHAQMVDADLAQARRYQQSIEAAADNRHLDVIGYGVAGEARRHVGVIDVARKSPITCRYCSLPSSRMRLSRSSR